MNLVNKQTPIALALMVALCAVSTSSQAWSSGGSNRNSTVMNEEINSASDLLRFQSKMSKSNAKSQEELLSKSLKLRAMTEYAKSVAIRSGIKSRINEIHNAVLASSRELDAIYDFAPLMIDGIVVPPVVSEANNLYNQKGDTQINRAEKIFKIERQARFASTAVNWRQYLNFPVEASAFEKYAYVAGDMKPQDAIEQQAWEEATIEGWNLGVQQANIILEQGMARLNRDYIGMVRFHTFVMQGKLSMPIINKYQLYDTNTGMTMVMDEELLRISVLPTFNSQATISSLPQHQLNPNEYVVIEDNAMIETPETIGKIFNKKPKNLVDADGVLIPTNGLDVVAPVAPLNKSTTAVKTTTTPFSGSSVTTTTVNTDAVNLTSIEAVANSTKDLPIVYANYNPTVLTKVQNVINDKVSDGKPKYPSSLSKKPSILVSRSGDINQPQSSEGIYGSQQSSDVLLIQIKNHDTAKTKTQ